MTKKKDKENCCIFFFVLFIISVIIVYWYVVLPVISFICIVYFLVRSRKKIYIKVKGKGHSYKRRSKVKPKNVFHQLKEIKEKKLLTDVDHKYIHWGEPSIPHKEIRCPKCHTGMGNRTVCINCGWEKSDGINPQYYIDVMEEENPNDKKTFSRKYCSYCDSLLDKSEQQICPYCGHNPHKKEEEKERSRHIPKAVQREVWRRDLGKCIECNSNEYLEYDHIIPFSKGGSNTVRNIQLLCESCNRKKHNKI